MARFGPDAAATALNMHSTNGLPATLPNPLPSPYLPDSLRPWLAGSAGTGIQYPYQCTIC